MISLMYRLPRFSMSLFLLFPIKYSIYKILFVCILMFRTSDRKREEKYYYQNGMYCITGLIFTALFVDQSSLLFVNQKSFKFDL